MTEPRTDSKSCLKPSVFPDYTDVTVPSNIAPLNFVINGKKTSYRTLFESGNYKFLIKGSKVCIPIRKWRELTSRNTDIRVTVFIKEETGWIQMAPFGIHIAQEIDPYVSYRIIPPSFETYQRLSINQRNLTNFKEKVIYANSMAMKTDSRQCINCHHFRNYHTDEMQFHIRQYLGGTVLLTQGHLHKINLKTDSTISAGVYPAWNPVNNFIAYSTNRTFQSLHTNNTNRVEVFDEESDLILYNTDDNTVSIIENDSTELECFPAWSPDGSTLYYVSAHIGSPSLFKKTGGALAHSQTIRYNLYSKSFNPQDHSWGPHELIIPADSLGQSITLPRVSPDGRWLMFTMGVQGVFHIWHKDSELCLMDLTDGSYRLIDEINSPEVESYHSWSSNGRWVIFSTRRDDGAYTRLYIAHMDEQGKFSKPFQLPQKDPEFSSKFMYSYNIPEFTVEPVKISARKLASFIKGTDAVPARLTN